MFDPDLIDCYNFTSTLDPFNPEFIDFVTTRPLECDIEGSYVIETDQILDMISAWNPDESNMSYHRVHRDQITLSICSTGEITLTSSKTENRNFGIHGIIMYICWSLLSMIQV